MHRRDFIRIPGAVACGALATATGLDERSPGAAPPSGQALDAGTYLSIRRVAATRFGRIAYVERGTGDAALFLHGFPLNSFQWRGAIERLAGIRRCVAPDFMGMGYTQVEDGQSLAPNAQAAMLAALLDALGIQRVDLVANDSGGAVAQLFLVQHPDRVRTLLLTNCDTEHDSPPPALLPLIEASKAGTFVDETFRPQLADKNFARSADGIGGLCYVDPAHPTDEAIDYYLAPLVSSPRRVSQTHAYAIALERNPLAGIEPKLKRCATPTRIVWGMADTIFARESPDYLHRTFGNSRGVRRLPDRKLFWPEELPDVVAEEARRLWRA